MVDEADVDMVGTGSGSSSPRTGSKRALDNSPTRRKPGPLPRHVCASPRPRSSSPAPFIPINSIVETPPILLPNGGETGSILQNIFFHFRLFGLLLCISNFYYSLQHKNLAGDSSFLLNK